MLGFQQIFPDGARGTDVTIHRFPIVAGLSYNNYWGQIDLTARYALNSTFDYYISPTQKREYTVIPFSVALGYKFIFETTETVSEGPEQEQEIERRLRERGALSGISLGAGVSTAFGVTKFNANDANRPFLNYAPSPVFTPDITVGFHIHEIDSEIRSAFRFMYLQKDAGFGVEQTFIRFAASLEFIKFLFDYNGFVPFVGIGAEFNYLSYQETGANPLDLSGPRFGFPIVLGWDIRPFVAVNWLLRTNLRYNPLLRLESSTVTAPFDQFEFNFIQFVYYPSRTI